MGVGGRGRHRAPPPAWGGGGQMPPPPQPKVASVWGDAPRPPPQPKVALLWGGAGDLGTFGQIWVARYTGREWQHDISRTIGRIALSIGGLQVPVVCSHNAEYELVTPNSLRERLDRICRAGISKCRATPPVGRGHDMPPPQPKVASLWGGRGLAPPQRSIVGGAPPTKCVGTPHMGGGTVVP